jgi:hypothetical protein
MAPEFGVLKPRFWGQKNENQDQHTQHIPLPGSTGIVPKGNPFGGFRQEAHKLPNRAKFS